MCTCGMYVCVCVEEMIQNQGIDFCRDEIRVDVSAELI